MKKKLMILIFLVTRFFVRAQNPTDTLSVKSFPDSSFRAEMIKLVDINKDHLLQYSEVWNIKTISLINGNVKSLSGIEVFTNLDSLVLATSATSLDLTKNEHMRYLSTYGHKELSSITVSKKAPYTFISAHDNGLTSFEVSGLSQLKTLLVGAQQLTYLNIQGTTLDHLNAAENPKMQVCVDNKAQWDSIPNNDLRRCFEMNPNASYCLYELTCLPVVTSLVEAEPIVDSSPHLHYNDFDLMGQELPHHSNEGVVIRFYENGKREKVYFHSK